MCLRSHADQSQSREFATLWADHRVRAHDVADYDLRHPLVGELTVTQQTLAGASAPETAIVLTIVESGSPPEAALRLLAQATAGDIRILTAA